MSESESEIKRLKAALAERDVALAESERARRIESERADREAEGRLEAEQRPEREMKEVLETIQDLQAQLDKEVTHDERKVTINQLPYYRYAEIVGKAIHVMGISISLRENAQYTISAVLEKVTPMTGAIPRFGHNPKLTGEPSKAGTACVTKTPYQTTNVHTYLDYYWIGVDEEVSDQNCKIGVLEAPWEMVLQHALTKTSVQYKDQVVLDDLFEATCNSRQKQLFARPTAASLLA